ncbi:recombinase family protein [Microbulbifer sp. HZ11]|uniref:recombinase family protein n=1 Tax=Microbulbifer sp. HZ11 TaxID=1453501 RepID=UPI0005BC24E9|nr:recombinase family protein [Microbulbifer sp. HZ11]
MTAVAYIRVSSTGQSLESQRDRVLDYGATTIFEEKKSGLDGARPELANCLKYLRHGDKLIIVRLDRLARSTSHLCQIADQLHEKGVELVVLDQQIDTGTPTGRLMFSMLGAIAQFETELRKERQLDGIASAKSRGVQFGRKAALTAEQIAEVQRKRAQGVLIKDLMSEYGVGKTTIYEALKAEVA